MNKQPLWKLCLIIATGLVVFFYILSVVTSRTEDGMSFIADRGFTNIPSKLTLGDI